MERDKWAHKNIVKIRMEKHGNKLNSISIIQNEVKFIKFRSYELLCDFHK